MHRQEFPGAHFAEPPQIVPGWNLRMHIHTDGQGYDVLFSDETDKKCAYAAVSDEKDVIRQSKMFPCGI